MVKSLQDITEYLLANASDPFPRYILKKEIQNEKISGKDIDAIHSSKWYYQLADEQWEDGSWGRFHSMDSSHAKKNKFVTTEAVLRRAHELSLTRDDPVVAKCIVLMERYVRGDETWRDSVEKHHDGGKSHLHSRPYLTAAQLNLFDPENHVVKPKRDVFVRTLEIAFTNGSFDEKAWEQENREYRGPCLNGWNAYPLMIMQNCDCMPDELQRQYLGYIWRKKEGIYYISSFAPAEKQCIDDKKFTAWLSSLELLSGFSLFPEFMTDAYNHLIGEINRLITDEVRLPAAHPISGHYSDSWRDKDSRKNDMMLRILRVLVKC
jgi:hypothetical protein